MSRHLTFDYIHISYAFLFLVISSILITLIPVVNSCAKKSSPKEEDPEDSPKQEDPEISTKRKDPERIFIASPKSIRFDSYQPIAIVGTVNEEIKISLKDYPSKRTDFYSSRVILQKESRNFDESFKLHVLYDSGYVFLQTDKPIYNPEQDVKIRVIPLNEDLLPKNISLHVRIRNPQNVIVHEKAFLEPWKTNNTEFPTLNYTFPPYPLFGKWSVTAHYGVNKNSSVFFNVEEYVLPMYKVVIKAPDFILPGRNLLDIKLLAGYYYGKKVSGTAWCKLSIEMHPSKNVTELLNINKTVENGEAIFSFNTNNILNQSDIDDFPYNSTLVVDVTVTDSATGNSVKASDKNCKFVKTPYLISLNNTIKDFKSNVKTAIVADITYANGKPAKNIPTSITAKDSGGQRVHIYDSKRDTDEDGRVVYFIYPPNNQKIITITVSTADESYEPNEQASESLGLQKHVYDSYIAISRTETARKLKIGETFAASILTQGNIENVILLVISRGKIVLCRYIPKGESTNFQLDFVVTAEMAPIIRIVVFSLQESKVLLGDTLRMFVENECEPKSEVAIEADFQTLEPGSKGNFVLKGEPRTIVGMLAVDKAVYGLKNSGRLTKEKLFEAISTRDLGDGPGGGIHLLNILSNAGITIFEIYEKGSKTNYDRFGGGGFLIRPIIPTDNRGDTDNEEDEEDFVIDDLVYDDIGFDHDDIDEVQERFSLVRKDFSESWLFQDSIIESDGTAIINATLPDSITTWVVQAVSVSRTWGMCISTPKEITSFKNIFIHLNIPYSVIRKEKLDIKATVYNYYPERIPVTVYMYGVAHLCSGVEPGKKSERKRIRIEGNSAESVTFSVVPMKAKNYYIRVVALSPVGSDVIVKRLKVVSEGVPKEEDIVIFLDPKNQQKRKRRHYISERILDYVNDDENFQLTKIHLKPKPKFIPGSDKYIISVIGTEYGPSAGSVLLDPEYLIKMPTGCCEQTMMYMGPTLYTLEFLKRRGGISLDLEEKLHDFVRIGYKKGLSFRKNDGSYALWSHSPSSTWLTAYVMKMFSLASKYIFVDRSVICKGVTWLFSQQSLDGGFRDPNPVFRRIMSDEESKIALTAFVLITLEECTCSSQKLSASRSMAKAFLEMEYSKINDSYAMALTAYALALTNSTEKINANEKLLQMSTFDEEMNYRFWQQSSLTLSIEVTAYGLLTQVQLNDWSNIQAILNWLNSVRLYGGSFPSSQATVVALQALSKYSIKSTSADIALTCNITAEEDGEVFKSVDISDDNALVPQSFQIENSSEVLLLRTSGKGVGVLSMKLKYNVLEDTEKVCKFEIAIDVRNIQEERFSGNDKETNITAKNNHDYREKFEFLNSVENPQSDFHNNVSQVQICARFLSNIDSGMTIIDVGISSGFNAFKDDLNKLVNDDGSPVDRYEIVDNRVILYLDHVSHQENTCLNFRIKRRYTVENVQASVLKVYDYYNNDNSCTILYVPESGSQLINPECEGIVCQCVEEDHIN